MSSVITHLVDFIESLDTIHLSEEDAKKNAESMTISDGEIIKF